MNLERVLLNIFASVLRDKNPDAWKNKNPLQYVGQAANDFVRNKIESATDSGLMVSKFGTVELNNLCAFVANAKKSKSLKDYWWYVRGYQNLYPKDTFPALCSNAGFFPKDFSLMSQWAEMVLEDMQLIDILGAYIHQEERFEKELSSSVKIDIDSYYAPFLWENPWTKSLEGKKVLVVHPFAESIKKQYEKREYLFDNKEVLPEFGDLIVIKAVQSIAGNGVTTGFENWFDALNYMKNEISTHEYDIALIGCGAYGMNLAAHVKREGKVAIHLGSWVQMLFGIYGNRWLNDQPQFKRFINDYWIRPSEEEKPKGAEKIENACYW